MYVYDLLSSSVFLLKQSPLNVYIYIYTHVCVPLWIVLGQFLNFNYQWISNSCTITVGVCRISFLFFFEHTRMHTHWNNNTRLSIHHVVILHWMAVCCSRPLFHQFVFSIVNACHFCLCVFQPHSYNVHIRYLFNSV